MTSIPCVCHRGTSLKMAKRRVYNVHNLQECLEFLEDSDDSAKGMPCLFIITLYFYKVMLEMLLVFIKFQS